MTRPVAGILVAVHPASFGPWDQDVAMVPATIVAVAHELGWLALLLTADRALATEPGEVLRLLDGLIVPDWGVGGDRYGELARELGQSAEAGGLPVLRLPASLLTPEATVTDYARAIGGLFTRDARVASG